MFSDQQVVTGLALLLSGYSQLSSGLSVYHWQIIIYLAWFSSLTHMTTLTILRQLFHDSHEVRIWRLVLMSLMIVMLCIGLLPTGDAIWENNLGIGSFTSEVPAICFFKRLFSRKLGER